MFNMRPQDASSCPEEQIIIPNTDELDSMGPEMVRYKVKITNTWDTPNTKKKNKPNPQSKAE